MVRFHAFWSFRSLEEGVSDQILVAQVVLHLAPSSRIASPRLQTELRGLRGAILGAKRTPKAGATACKRCENLAKHQRKQEN